MEKNWIELTALVALSEDRGSYTGAVLAHIGGMHEGKDEFLEEVEAEYGHAQDVFNDVDLGRLGPGLHVFDGRVHYPADGNGKYDGVWRKASIEDVEHFLKLKR